MVLCEYFQVHFSPFSLLASHALKSKNLAVLQNASVEP